MIANIFLVHATVGNYARKIFIVNLFYKFSFFSFFPIPENINFDKKCCNSLRKLLLFSTNKFGLISKMRNSAFLRKHGMTTYQKDRIFERSLPLSVRPCDTHTFIQSWHFYCQTCNRWQQRPNAAEQSRLSWIRGKTHHGTGMFREKSIFWPNLFRRIRRLKNV